MADVSITNTALTANTASADLVGSGTAVNATQTFALTQAHTLPGSRLVVVLEEVGGSGATVTFDAGDYPPALTKEAVGSSGAAISLAANDLKVIMLEKARFLQSDGSITGTVATANCRIRVLAIPEGV